MKKVSFLIITLLLILPFMIGINNVSAAKKNKVNVYIFRGEGCPHCEEAIEWFEDELANDEEYSNYYKLVKYEVWYDESNKNLMDQVATELGTSASGVPFIVVGDKYFSGFSKESSPSQVKEEIKKQYENKDYQDIVDAVKKGKSINKGDSKAVLPIVIISAIAIVAVLALVFFTKEKE